MDAAAAAKAGEANVGAADEVLRLRAQMAEMAAQQKEWDDAWWGCTSRMQLTHSARNRPVSTLAP
jgi:hypothetical protein